MEEFEDRINEENRTTIEERNRQRRREREDRRRRKRNQQYCSQLSYKSEHPIWDNLLLPLMEGFANSITRRNYETMVDPLVIISRHRDKAIRPETAEPIAETQDVSDPIKAPRQYSNPFPVNSHIRNLAQGMNASAEKQATAQEHGVTLKEGQTWVKDYVKGASKDRQ